MKPSIYAVIGSRLGRDETGRWVFLEKSFALTERITQETRDLPVEVRVFAAVVNWPAALAYGLFVLAPVSIALGWFLGRPAVGLLLGQVCLIAGALVLRTNPRLFRRGQLLRTVRATS